MRTLLLCVFPAAFAALAPAQLAPPIENPTGRYLTWGDYKIEVNQYGDLGRNWPTPTLCHEQFALLKAKAQANPRPPTTIRCILLVLPNTDAVAYRKNPDGTEVEVGRRSTSMTSAEIKWALDQWREFEELVYVWSGGNAWLRTDIKVIDAPLQVKTDEKWGFWAGQHAELMKQYIPWERGDYQSYNCIYNSKGLNAGPHGGTIGAVYGILGVGTSDNAYYGEQWKPNRTGYVALHEWLNQQCSATSNILPYPDGETLWNNYVLQKMGYREDVQLDDWPWYCHRRDTMHHIICPQMWRRWTTIDPYASPAIAEWTLFGPRPSGQARAVSTLPAADGQPVEMELEKYTHFNLARARVHNEDPVPVTNGTYYLRTWVDSDTEQEVRLWAGADERFQLWLNGIRVRDGWGWNYSADDGRLFEKVTFVTLPKGLSTLVLELPNGNSMAEFRVRFCATDGSGRQPTGVRTTPVLPAGREPLPLGTPQTPDFAQPRLYQWADVHEDPWMLLPRLDEAALRMVTGVPSLAIRTGNPLPPDTPGKDYLQAHLHFDVPRDAVTSPWTADPLDDGATLNNDLDWNWESLAWLRLPGRNGPEKDLVVVRVDVAEPLLHLLRTTGRPAHESIVGWVLVEHKLAYVALVNLAVDQPPATALELLSRAPE